MSVKKEGKIVKIIDRAENAFSQYLNSDLGAHKQNVRKIWYRSVEQRFIDVEQVKNKKKIKMEKSLETVRVKGLDERLKMENYINVSSSQGG